MKWFDLSIKISRINQVINLPEFHINSVVHTVNENGFDYIFLNFPSDELYSYARTKIMEGKLSPQQLATVGFLDDNNAISIPCYLIERIVMHPKHLIRDYRR